MGSTSQQVLGEGDPELDATIRKAKQGLKQLLSLSLPTMSSGASIANAPPLKRASDKVTPEEGGPTSWLRTHGRRRARREGEAPSSQQGTSSGGGSLLPWHLRWRRKRDPCFTQSIDTDVQVGAVHIYPDGHDGTSPIGDDEESGYDSSGITAAEQQHESQDLEEADSSPHSEAAVRNESEVAEDGFGQPTTHSDRAGTTKEKGNTTIWFYQGFWVDLAVWVLTASVILLVVLLFLIVPVARNRSVAPNGSSAPSATTARSKTWEEVTRLSGDDWLVAEQMDLSVAIGGNELLAVGSTLNGGTVETWLVHDTTTNATVTRQARIDLDVTDPATIIVKLSDDGLSMAVAVSSLTNFGLVQVYRFNEDEMVWSLEAGWGSASDGFGSAMDLSEDGEVILFVSEAGKTAKAYRLPKGDSPKQTEKTFCLSCQRDLGEVVLVSVSANQIGFGAANGVALFVYEGTMMRTWNLQGEGEISLGRSGPQHDIRHGRTIGLSKERDYAEVDFLESHYGPKNWHFTRIGAPINFGKALAEDEFVSLTFGGGSYFALALDSQVSIYSIRNDRVRGPAGEQWYDRVVSLVGERITTSANAPRVAVSTHGKLVAVSHSDNGVLSISILRRT